MLIFSTIHSSWSIYLLKFVFIFLGTISLCLGVVGISVPGLPTTPFLLLSATLYFKGSKRCYSWLLNHEILGKFIRDYQVNRAISLKTKVVSILTMWIMICSSIIFFISNFYIDVLLLVLGIIGTFFMGRIRTYEKV